MDDREWDDFLSVSQSEPEAREIQGFRRQLRRDYPPRVERSTATRMVGVLFARS